MKNVIKLIVVLIVFVLMMVGAVGFVHLSTYLDGPFKYSGIAIILIVVILLGMTCNKKIRFLDDSLEIKALIGKKRLVPYDTIKSVEYIETKISCGRGIRTKVRNIRFNLIDGSLIQYAETRINYKKCVRELLDAHDSGKLQHKAIKPATKERLLNSIN